ncbi:hypothetical protein [Deinococcus puniceus]|uniref:Uncharacterized protein n=1 Tax=Deinococcus puniceus TaxID=1182568 RepID=A0A172T9T4_9DEIO|nr:hypothetical protein [Deinococcus puniceus]ANE43697.1 hypothetical protein SU48_07885 [Deinococcus puniceus]
MKNLYKGILYSKYHTKENHIFVFQEQEYSVVGDDFKDWARYHLPHLVGGIYRFHDSVLIAGYFEDQTIHVSSVFRETSQLSNKIFDQKEFRESIIKENAENCVLGILEYMSGGVFPKLFLTDKFFKIVDSSFICWLQEKFPDPKRGGLRFRYWTSIEFEESEGEIHKVLRLHINLWSGLWYTVPM